MALAQIDPERASDSIAPLLTDPRPEMRFSALWALSMLGPRHAARIAAALDDRDPEVRLAAAQCLGELGVSELADRLAPVLDDPDKSVEFGVATTLASLGDPRGAPLLRAALRDSERAFAAAIGLGDLRDSTSHGELARLAKSWFGSPIVRAAAARALVRLGDAEGERVLGKLVRSWRIEARQYATELVGELELTNLVPELARNLQRCSAGERAVIRTALQTLAGTSLEARALLASIGPADHPV
jgi:HEAT repeat protein